MSENLTRDDLVLLMDSYRNHFAMNQTLLGQLSKIIDNQTSITQKQDTIISKQSNVCDRLSECADKLASANDKIDGMKEDIVEKIYESSLENTKEHGSVKNKIYVGMVGSALIIIALIGLLAKVW